MPLRNDFVPLGVSSQSSSAAPSLFCPYAQNPVPSSVLLLSDPQRGLRDDWQVPSSSSRRGEVWHFMRGRKRQVWETCLGLFSPAPPSLLYAADYMTSLPKHLLGHLWWPAFHFVVSLLFFWHTHVWVSYELRLNARTHSLGCLWSIFQAVLGQRKLSSWQVFLTRCRQTWCTPSQIQHPPEGMAVEDFSSLQ